jgi:two-component system, chemotaxis family, response regulator Rcp1
LQLRQKRMKILLVDDSEADVYLFREAFQAVQSVHELEIARDGDEALQHLHAAGGKEHLPDLIMLDLNLPKVDGFEVLRAIRADSKLRAIPVIVLSSSSNQRQVRRAYELGANAYIVKPLDDFVDLVGDFECFWLRRAELP